LIVCEQLSSSTSGVARRQSFKALSPASESHFHPLSPLPFQRPFSDRLSGGGLAFELPQCELHPLAAVTPVRRCRIGNADGALFRSMPSVSRVDRLNVAGALARQRSVLSAKGAGNVWASSEVVERQDHCSFLKPSMACQRFGPERRCPLTSPVQTVVQFKKQRQAAQPRPSSGRLTHYLLVVVKE
jgi:hypothetical protein